LTRPIAKISKSTFNKGKHTLIRKGAYGWVKGGQHLAKGEKREYISELLVVKPLKPRQWTPLGKQRTKDSRESDLMGERTT